MRTERSDSSLSTRRAVLFPICGSHRVRVNILGRRRFRGQYAQSVAVDVVARRGFRHHRFPYASESDTVRLHQRREAARRPRRAEFPAPPRRAVGSNAASSAIALKIGRAHVPDTPTDDDLERHRCRSSGRASLPG